MGAKPDVITYNILAGSFARNGLVLDAKDLLAYMENQGDVEKALTVFQKLWNSDVILNEIVYAKLIASLCRVGNLTRARYVFDALVGHIRLKRKSFGCHCCGAFVNFDNASLSTWAPVVDQALLMASMVLAYMAGVVPSKMPSFSNERNMFDAVPSKSHFCDETSNQQTNLGNVWGKLKGKLLDALDAMQLNGRLDNRTIEVGKYCPKRPMSLYAVDESPRLRLLLATVQQLEKEAGTVNNLSGSYQNASRDDWSIALMEIMQKSCQPLFVAWLEEELYLQNRKHDKEKLVFMLRNSKADETILQSIKRSGKEDLYVDILYLIRFGPFRNHGHYDLRLLTNHLLDILEDLVALNQWLHQNMESIVSMYEDRFDLNTLCVQLVEEPTLSETRRLSWWKKLTFSKPASTSLRASSLVINQISMLVKRTKELRALRGWRYYFSLLLEFSDITMPMVRTIFSKVSDAISFFLVCLIGRSLGLIYTGIRQSLVDPKCAVVMGFEFLGSSSPAVDPTIPGLLPAFHLKW
ncbi:hypothetical protein Sjap_005889 [Stephania japonica]|uniref:Pentatricopeptide repeat-containing protein n=1 Tax=Stephania japonica TaxID=461633 RepID=A0AAP0K524_9MAGN